ncbi:MAG: enoyl-CoA hydratase/isomerase family protein [Elusimicrobia bacterium]|nr:enoyl-CoA hydratase/isomerase family protein [Elusimicrobiota bacterium]MDE2237106.1 enoyl-CoA hydratase/isomerase family protein [Elusimicrobiota bacterium]MDE2426446.1 enoyl-CoA hydratase/isomerase family protein [Elusimicrobiota bacterium]
MAAELVKSERRGPVGLLTLNRPQALNALNHPLMDQLEAGLDRFAAEAAVRCVVITGGERAFAAGADIKEMDRLSAAQMAADSHLSRWDKLGDFPKPTLAAVSGFALGGGCELALACDLIVASESAQFGQPELALGVIPGAGGTVRLARALGKARAMELVLTGRRLGAREALSQGLVNAVFPVESYLREALALAERLASLPALAAAAAKKSVAYALDHGLEESLRRERALFASLFDTRDQKEGMKAFIEKRKPAFTGT